MDRSEYLRYAAVAAEALKKALGNVVTYNDAVGVISIEIYDAVHFVYPMPEIEYYGKEVTKITFNYPTFTLRFDGEREYTINLSPREINIFGEKYSFVRPSSDKYIGHLNGDMFTSYVGWIKTNSYPDLVHSGQIDFKDYRDGDILDIGDFRPVEAQKVNIINDGFKLVSKSMDCALKIDKCTVFGGEYIAYGHYSKYSPSTLIKYIDDDSDETFTLLIDPKTKAATLSGSSQCREMAKLSNCVVERRDGLYDGFALSLRGENVYFDTVYRYMDMFFIIGNSMIVLSARKPGSGKYTKSAAYVPEM